MKLSSSQALPTMKELLGAHGGQIKVDLKSSEEIAIILALPLAKREHYAT